LIGGSSSKFFHLKEFGDALTKFNVEYKLVHDVEIYDGFPSRKIRNWIPNRAKFNQLIKEFRPDAIFVDRHAHFGVAALETKIPLFVHLRGDYWSEIKWAKETLYKSPIKRVVISLKDRLAQKCFDGAATILPICDYLRKIVKIHYPHKPVEVLYQGIDASHWYRTDNMELKHPCVGLLQGSVIWGKTREMLTLTKVLEKMPDVNFYWVGDGPYREKVLPSLSRYDNFKWIGSLQYPDKVRDYLSQVDVYALATGIDMSPLTLLEAQLMRKPVLATNVGGVPELMRDGETGFLIEKENSKEWIDKINLLLNDEQKAKQFGEHGRKFVENNFGWEKISKNFLNITKQAMDKS
jgi:hypothetical protein